MNIIKFRIWLLPGALLVLALLTVGCGPEIEDSRPEERPNIVFILTDDMAKDDLEVMSETRRLLGDEGVEFSNAFVTFSLCCPSRATILRGQYAHNHRIIGNFEPYGGSDKFRELGHDESTIATWLQSGGYETVHIGKYLNGYDDTYVPPGWDDWYAWMGSYESHRLNENGTPARYDPKERHETDVLSDKAVEYIKGSGEDPFFMQLATQAPHGPATPAPRHKDALAGVEAPRPPSFNEEDVGDKPDWVSEKPPLSEKQISYIDDYHRDRLRSLLSVDEMIARLVKTLKSEGKLDNTYLVFTSDNGYHEGHHRILGGKLSAYEEDIRIPLLVRGPGVPRGEVLDHMALNNDLAPTFADWGGASTPDFVDGRSLEPLLGDEPPPESDWRSAFAVEGWQAKLPGYPPSPIPTYKGIRTRDFTYVEYATGERELYDLREDPYQLESLHETADPALIEDLRARLDALKDCEASECRTAEDRPE